MADEDGRLRIHWRTVAIVAVVLGIAAAVLAAIVSSIRNVDSLSVIALALAVIAFVVQIIVYVAQADSAAKQQIQAAEVYGKTLSALAAIEEKAEGTRTTVNTLSGRLLDAAIGKAIPEAESEGSPVESPEFADTVSRIVRDIVNVPGGDATQRPRPGLRRRISDDSMFTFPSPKTIARTVDVMSSLSDVELSGIYRLAQDQARSGGGSDDTIGAGLRSINPFYAKDLVDKKIVVRRRVPWSTDPVFQLTELGKDIGRVLLSQQVPDNTDPRVLEYRDRLLAYREKVARETQSETRYKGIPISD